MKIGFTGTREGMTERQQKFLLSFFMSLGAENFFDFLHGACVGADEQAVEIAKYNRSGHAQCWISALPPTKPAWLSEQAVSMSDTVAKPAPYLVRNRDIVDACDLLIGCPLSMSDDRKGGTWYTINYARKRGVPYLVIPPEAK